MSEEGPDIVVYGHPRSGNAYKPVLMLALTGTPCRFELVDLPGGEQAGDAFREVSPFAKLPVMRHGDVTIRQSNTILLHLAASTKRFGGQGQADRIRISEWLFFEQDMIFPGIGRTRFFTKVMKADPAVVEYTRGVGHRALDELERALGEDAFLAGAEPTIADISIYAYARLAEDAGFDLSARPRVVAWRRAMEALPGWDTPENLMAR